MKAGVCSYEDERGRHVVIGRFLALASICRDWCSVAFDETQEDVPSYWIDGLNVEPIYVGQLLSEEELPGNPDDAFADGLRMLLDGERGTVVRALRAAYGGTDEDMFVALWRSMDPSSDAEDPVDLNELTPGKLAGWQWISEGCPNVRPV